MFDLYRALWRFAAGRRRQYVAALALLAGVSLVKLCVPLLAGTAINTIQIAGDGSLVRAGWLILGVFGVQVAAWCLHFPGRVLERNVGIHVRTQLADALYVKLVSLPVGWHEGHHSGAIQHRAQMATSALFEFAQNQYIYLQSLIYIAGPLIALAVLSPVIGAIALCGYVILGTIIVRFDAVMVRLQREQQEHERRYAARLLDFLGNISTVIALRLESASRVLVAQRLVKVFAPLRKNIVVNETKWAAVDLLSSALTWTLVCVYAWRAHATDAAGTALMLGSVFMVYQYANSASGVVSTMAQHLQNFTRIRTDVAAADPVWQASPRAGWVGLAADSRPEGRPTNIAPEWRQIDVRGLSFEHARRGTGAVEAKAAGIRDVNLSLRRGERIALIGPSGSGKSTLLRLIAGLYDPQHGYYSVDGETVFGARHLGAIATLIPQEAEIFEATARENLTFGADRDEGAIQRAARTAAFDSVIASLPQGLDTPISERGFNLSGGQRQRLALARGLLAAEAAPGRPSSILLLDEPTSALDQRTEAQIFERLRSELPHTTVIAAVHRLSSLEHFDRAVLMHEGAVLDVGTRNELGARQPLFREMLREDEAIRPLPLPAAAAASSSPAS